jgi:hypothetical protein
VALAGNARLSVRVGCSVGGHISPVHWADDYPQKGGAMSKKSMKEEDRNEAIRFLLNTYHLHPGMKVYTDVKHVSRSGMSRSISVHVLGNDERGEACIYDITGLVAAALDYPLDRKNYGVKVGGCGMDMCFHVVYSLGQALWPDGFKTREGYWRNEPMSFERDGGYALKKQDL